MESEDRIQIISDVCEKCANILKDPTHGGKLDLDSNARTQAREDAYEDLMTAINTLCAVAEYNEGFFDVVNIAKKLHEKVK
jgi:hypothetical protein